MYLSTSCYNANDEWYGFNHHQSEKQFIISQRELATIFVLVCYHMEAIHEPSVVYFVISISLDALFQCIRIVVVFGDFVTIYYALYVRHNKLVIPVVHCTYICTNVLSCKTVYKALCRFIHLFFDTICLTGEPLQHL